MKYLVVSTVIKTILVIIFLLAAYIISALGMYKCLLKTSSMSSKAWMAFIPIANFYAIGRMLQEYRGFDDYIVWILTIAPVCIWIPIVGMFIAILWYALYMILWIKFLDSFEASAGLIISFIALPPAFGFILADNMDNIE